MVDPRINQKLKQKYGDNPNIKGRVVEDNLGVRAQGLSWEQYSVDMHKTIFGEVPRYQFMPKASE